MGDSRALISTRAGLNRTFYVRFGILLLILLALCTVLVGLPLLGEPQARQWTKEDRLKHELAIPRTVERHSPVFEIVNSLREDMVQCDGSPSIRVAEWAGYRILTRTTYPSEPENPHSFPCVRYTDLVLFPANVPTTPRFSSRIPWEKFQFEENPEVIYLGEGRGYRWFARAALGMAIDIRKQFDLKGGDNLLGPLERNLSRNRDPDHRRWALGTLADAGEDAIPTLKEEIVRNAHRCRWYAVDALAKIPGEKSTGLLLTVYGTYDNDARQGVPYALANSPRRAGAKRVYLDMLRRPRDRYAGSAIDACVSFGWREAIPILEEQRRQPYGPRSYTSYSRAIRALEGNPVPDAISQAGRILGNRCGGTGGPHDGELEASKQLILHSGDIEAATWEGIDLAVFTAKGSGPKTNEAGIEILRGLPKATVLPVLRNLAVSVREWRLAEAMQKVLAAVEAPSSLRD